MNVVVQEILKSQTLGMEPGDEVISVTWFRDYAILATKKGAMYAVSLGLYP